MRFLKGSALALFFLVAACGGKDRDARAPAGDSPAAKGSPVAGGTVIRHLESDCKTLNWVLYTTSHENYVLRYLYDHLLDYDENMDIIPVLAEDFHVSDDRLRITIRLRQGLHWHDGAPITSKDIKFTVDKILDPAVPAINKTSWFDRLDEVKVVDDRTVVFVWKEAYAPSLDAIAQFAPIPEHIYGKGDFLTHTANRSPVGSGPFKFEDWSTSQMISLVRNDDYYREKPYLDRIIFKVIPEQSVALNALKTGQIDEMRMTQTQWENQTNDSRFLQQYARYSYFVPQYNYLSWNCKSVWFGDKRVRRAMTMLFDRETINAELYSGAAETVSGPFYVNSWAYDKSVKPWPYDPAEAKRLLDEAGWRDTNRDGIRDKNGVKFEFEFTISSGSRNAQQFAQLLQESCEKVGIKLKIVGLEGATFFDRISRGQYDGTALAWRLENDPDDIYETFHTSQAPPKGNNHTFYSNPRVDSLLELGRVSFDRESREKLYHEVHRLIHEDQPYTFVNSVPEKRAISKRIGNIIISPNGPFDFYPGADYWFVAGEMANVRGR